MAAMCNKYNALLFPYQFIVYEIQSTSIYISLNAKTIIETQCPWDVWESKNPEE